jgi:rhodanese-related sulfurtransferase
MQETRLLMNLPIHKALVAWSSLALLAGTCMAQVEKPSRDRSLYVSAREALQLMSPSESLAIVDVRDEKAYRDAHPPGAIRLPLACARAPRLTAQRPVLLVDDGWGALATERACRRLRDQGVAAFILWGGMGGWLARGGPVEGPSRMADDLGAMTPQAFLAQQTMDDWRVVDLSDAAPTAEALRARLPAPGAPVRLLLLDRDGQAAPSLRAAAHEAGFDSVFTVAGGSEALEKEIAFTRQMRQSTRRTVTTTGHAQHTRVVGGGCSACP